MVVWFHVLGASHITKRTIHLAIAKAWTYPYIYPCYFMFIFPSNSLTFLRQQIAHNGLASTKSSKKNVGWSIILWVKIAFKTSPMFWQSQIIMGLVRSFSISTIMSHQISPYSMTSMFQLQLVKFPKSIQTGWWFQPLWKISVSWDSSQYMGKYKKCSKPPTSKSSFRLGQPMAAPCPSPVCQLPSLTIFRPPSQVKAAQLLGRLRRAICMVILLTTRCLREIHRCIWLTA